MHHCGARPENIQPGNPQTSGKKWRRNRKTQNHCLWEQHNFSSYVQRTVQYRTGAVTHVHNRGCVCTQWFNKQMKRWETWEYDRNLSSNRLWNLICNQFSTAIQKICSCICSASNICRVIWVRAESQCRERRHLPLQSCFCSCLQCNPSLYQQ